MKMSGREKEQLWHRIIQSLSEAMKERRAKGFGGCGKRLT